MRTLNKNKQKLFYALYGTEIPVYERDANGDIVYISVDGKQVPVESGSKEMAYGKPVEFKGNIAMSGGESQAVEFGIDLSQYAAVLVVDKGLLPIDETSVIWHTTEPKINADGTSDEHTADYKVVKCSPSINVDRYILQKVVK